MKYFCFIVFLSISPLCFAQKQTTTFIKANGQKTTSKDSALLIRTITDPRQGSNLYGFTEVFVSGEPFRTGKTSKADDILPEDNCTAYYPSGKKLSEIFYTNGLAQAGTFYFPNGTVFKVSRFTHTTPDPTRPAVRQELITTCNDSTGKALVINGNGYFVGYRPVMDKGNVIDKRFVTKVTDPIYDNWLVNDFEEGEMKNGIKDGAWKGEMGNVQYTEVYKKGKLVSGESDKDGMHYHYEGDIVHSAQFPGGMQAFYQFIGSTTHYPDSAKANNIQGKVYASFVINKDGALTDIKILKSPGDDLSDETVRVLKLSPPWAPGNQRGVPVRQQFTVPVSYNLPAKK